MTPDKRVEKVQQSIKNLLYKAQEKNWKNGGVSIYDLSDLQEASDRVITQYHQDLMSEVVEKLEGKKKAIRQEINIDDHYKLGYNQALTEAQNIIKSTLLESKN